MKIGIVGYGVVGKHICRDVENAGHTVAIYDVQMDFPREDINTCDAAFVCVSTPMNPDGSANLGAIDEVFSWLRVPIVMLRSTVPPGTTYGLSFRHNIVFVPEFIGEGINAPYNAMKQPPFLIIGGFPAAREEAAGILMRVYNSECEFIFTDATTAETAKYAENYFLALKVGWANEMFDICQKVGADFGQMMNAVTHDYRIGRSHTHVYNDNRGWDGRCLPKDLSALLAVAGKETAPLLASAIASNEIHRARSKT